MRNILFGILLYPFIVSSQQQAGYIFGSTSGTTFTWYSPATLKSAWGINNISGTWSDTTRSNIYTQLAAKQSALVSGTTIKTVNGSNLLGSGDIAISGTAAWGSVTGTLSNQSDLQTALNLKANLASPDFTGTPTGIGIPVYAQVTGSNVTTTGQSLVNITGLSVPLTTNATYELEAILSCQTSAVTTGTAYGINYSVAGGAIEAQITGSSTATATKTLRINALNTATTLYLAGSGQTGGILIKGRITTGVNAGNLTVQHLKLSSGTSTIFIGSILKVTRIN